MEPLEFRIYDEWVTLYLFDEFTIGWGENEETLIYVLYLGDFHVFKSKEVNKYHILYVENYDNFFWLKESFETLEDAKLKIRDKNIADFYKEKEVFFFERNVCLPNYIDMPTEKDIIEYEIQDYLEWEREVKENEESSKKSCKSEKMCYSESKFSYGLYRPDVKKISVNNKIRYRREEYSFYPDKETVSFFKRLGSAKQRRIRNHKYKNDLYKYRDDWDSENKQHKNMRGATIHSEHEVSDGFYDSEEYIKMLSYEPSFDLVGIEGEVISYVHKRTHADILEEIEAKKVRASYPKMEESDKDADSEEQSLEQTDFFHKEVSEEKVCTKNNLFDKDEKEKKGYDWAGALSVVSNPNYRRCKNWEYSSKEIDQIKAKKKLQAVLN